MNSRGDPAPDAASAAGQLTQRSTKWTARIIRLAARKAPADLSDRLEEEWLADLAERRGGFARLRFAVGCCWATKVIAFEHSAVNVPAMGATTAGSRLMAAYAQHDPQLFSRRTLSLIGIVGLHVVLIYAFANGLTHGLRTMIPDRMMGVVVPDVPVNRVPPPLPQPVLEPRRFTIPEPDIRIDEPPPVANQVTAVPIADPPVISQPALPAKVIERVGGGPGRAFPNTRDYYPADAIRKGQEGIATVRACVDERGRLTESPTIATSSGVASLDEGALRLAKAGSGHYRASTEDGRPVDSCFMFGIRFKMTGGY